MQKKLTIHEMINVLTNEVMGENCFIGYYPNCFDKHYISFIKNYLKKQENFQGGLSGWGKEIPRLQKWHQMDGYNFSHRWKSQYSRWDSFPYDRNLLDIQNKVNDLTKNLIDSDNLINFNSCLINYYRNGNDSIKPHFDSMDNFGEKPLISIISIGETRDIFFKRRLFNPNNPKSLKLDKNNSHLNCSIKLKEGSLLIMGGSTQKYYIHEIPKTKTDVGERFSLTFREFLF